MTRSRALLDSVEDSSSSSEEEELSEEGSFLTINDDVIDPQSFNEAYFDPNLTRRNLWRQAISKELQSMKEKDVWVEMEKDQIPTGRKVIGNR